MPALASAPPSSVRPITRGEFALFQALIYREAGIHLAPVKEALLVGRLSRRLRALGLDSFGAYHRRITEEGDTAELARMLEAVCTHETHFFREPRHFEFLAHDLFPRWKAEAAAGRRSRQVRIWSAACSSGQEPFSLAMLALDHLPAAEGWEVEVLASDLSTQVLERARGATWPLDKAAEIPEPYLRAYLLRGKGAHEGTMRAGSELRAMVRFERVNLNDETYPVSGTFDLVFCRNVLIYFDAASRAGVVRRLLARLAPGGHFFLGHAESLNGMDTPARGVIPTVYTVS